MYVESQLHGPIITTSQIIEVAVIGVYITGRITSIFAGADKRRTCTLLGQKYLMPEIGGDLHYCYDYNVNATEYY